MRPLALGALSILLAATPALAAGTDGTNVDVDAPSKAESHGAWYIPPKGEAFTRPVVEPKGIHALSIIYDFHGFVSGTAKGTASEFTLRYGDDMWGVHLGLLEMGNWLVLGGDIARYQGALIAGAGTRTQWRILFPYFDYALLLQPGSPIGVMFRGATSATGIRLTVCQGAGLPFPLRIDLRLPTLGVWVPVTVNGEKPFDGFMTTPITIGASLDIGALL